MRTPRPFLALLRLEARHLLLGRAWICLALLLSLLVGIGFRQAVTLYADASRSALGAGDLAQGLNPFDGILVPTFGALYLVATLLLPFVATRQMGLEAEGSGWKLLLRSGFRASHLLTAKVVVLATFWFAMLMIPLAAVGLWRGMGGHVHGPELMGLLVGHGLYGLAVAAVACLASAVTQQAAMASLLTLAATLGSWVLDFNTAMGAGWVRILGALSLTQALRPFERGLVDGGHLATWGLGLLLLLAGAGLLLRPGRTWLRHLMPCLALLLVGGPILFSLGRWRASWDLTEDRRHSFPRAVERALAALPDRLLIDVFLDGEDPRWADLNRQILSKLRRTVPHLDIRQGDLGAGRFGGPGAGSFGGAAGERYGEVHYRYQGREDMSRSTSPEEVLQVLWALCRIPVPPEEPEPAYPGYPLASRPRGAGLAFYLALPFSLLLVWLTGWMRVPRRPWRSS